MRASTIGVGIFTKWRDDAAAATRPTDGAEVAYVMVMSVEPLGSRSTACLWRPTGSSI
jgi:hypothetical protein